MSRVRIPLPAPFRSYPASGLGDWTFNPGTRVQIPLGAPKYGFTKNPRYTIIFALGKTASGAQYRLPPVAHDEPRQPDYIPDISGIPGVLESVVWNRQCQNTSPPYGVHVANGLVVLQERTRNHRKFVRFSPMVVKRTWLVLCGGASETNLGPYGRDSPHQFQWKCARVAKGACLENSASGNRHEGSNPSISANIMIFKKEKHDMGETIKLTINRWHKVRGRLSTMMDKAKHNAEVLGGIRVDNLSVVPSQMEKLMVRADEAWNELLLFQRYSVLVSTIRKVVARNSVYQISALLSELDAVQAQQAVIAGILEAASATNPSIADLPEALSALKEHSSPYGMSLTVQMLSLNRRKELTEKRDGLLKKAFALQEQIAEENQRLVSITFEEDADLVRQMLGQ